MDLKMKNLVFCFTLLFMFVSMTAAPDNLDIRDRGNRREGIEDEPVSGFDIELISVLVNYTEESEQMPDQFRLKFYLHEPEFLFHVDLAFQADLDKPEVSAELRQAFENNDITLSEDLAVSIEEKGNRWRITDKEIQRTYTVSKATDQIDIYGFLVYLTVRELHYEHNYWLDKVLPPKPWQPGFDNEFEWPTEEVILQLDGLEMKDLGVVARLGTADPAEFERVAPVIFYHSKPPKFIKKYRFTFYPNEDVNITRSVYRITNSEDGEEPVYEKEPHDFPGGRSFSFTWDSSTAAEGRYRLVISGYMPETNDPIEQSVEFYHKPVVEWR
ncbi:MAG: hypothetical protein O7C75_00720 [Verrucomicrobia bacterium]|nr:hypothetical protein [Verrucomicrobiota bacterium]